jgi:hypothetical protein
MEYGCNICGLSFKAHGDDPEADCPKAECPLHGRRLVSELLKDGCINCRRVAELYLREVGCEDEFRA